MPATGGHSHDTPRMLASSSHVLSWRAGYCKFGTPNQITQRSNTGTAVAANKRISSLLKSFFVSSEAAKPRSQFFLPSFQVLWQLVQVHAVTVQFPGWWTASHCCPTHCLSVGEPRLCFLGSWGNWFQML